MRQDELPVVFHKEFVLPGVLDIGRHLKGFARKPRRLHEAKKLKGLAPEIVGVPPDDVLLAAGGPVADGGEVGTGIGRGCLRAHAPEIGHHRLTCREPVKPMGGHHKGGSPDVLSEGEEMPVGLEVIDRSGDPLVDLDLLHAGIALHVDQITDRLEFLVEVVRSADIQRAVGLPVEGPEFGKRHAGTLKGFLVTGAVGPAPLEPVLLCELSKHLCGMGVVVGDIEGDRIVGIVGGVLDVVDLVTQTLEAHDVVDVLPDDSGDGHSAHESEDDDFFAFHEFGAALVSCPAAR